MRMMHVWGGVRALRRWGLASAALLLLGVTPGMRAYEAPSPLEAGLEQATQRAASASASTPVRQMVDQYCVSCHSARAKAGQLVLEGVDPARVADNPALWEKVLVKLRSRAMPPVSAPRPDSQTYQSTSAWLTSELDRAAMASPNPGRKAMFHRLNRTEYANAVRDLLALDVDTREMLPTDDGSFGFDNIATALTVSSGRLERYMIAASKIARLAVGDPTLRPSVETYQLTNFALLQADRMSEDMPFGSQGGAAVRHFFPLDGEYDLRVILERTALTGGIEHVRGLDEEAQVDLRVDGALIKSFRVRGRGPRGGENPYKDEEEWDKDLTLRFPAKAGTHLISVTFPKRTWYQENVGLTRVPARSAPNSVAHVSERTHGKVEVAIDRLELAGPFNGVTPTDTPSRRRLFVCRPSASMAEDQCARTIARTLARRAYRRPATETDVDQLLVSFREGRTDGSFDRGVQTMVARALSDPEFLFRIEVDPRSAAPGVPYRIDDVQLASRLSFFLWSSIPDDELLDLAARRALRDPRVLEQQVKRMLADARAQALMSNFFGQWLQVRNMSSHMPDPKLLPQFDENLRQAFERETEMFLQSQIQGDRPVLEMFDANYTFLNERLAQHYGIPNVYGSHYRRVSYPDDRRAGLLSHGSILTVTSYPDRTSPVVRGKWVLENVLGSPPPPPPADVPALPDKGADGKPQSMRGRLEQHRKNPVCGACHSRMDPLGFALENFDAVGRWREQDAGTRVDASGSMPDGTAFNGPATFRRALLDHRDQVLETITEKLMTYALGRGIDYYDMPALRRLIKGAEERGGRWSALVTAIAMSQPFTMRMPAPAVQSAKARTVSTKE